MENNAGLQPTGYMLTFGQLQRDLVNHGYGEMIFRVTSMKDETVRVDILCGKSYVFFLKKEIRFK